MAQYGVNHSTLGVGPVNQPIRVVGIDIAKPVFHLVGMDGRETVVWRQRLYRSPLMAFITTLPPAVIGMDACGGAHDWARRFREQGHEVHLMPL
jgi:transposase